MINNAHVIHWCGSTGGYVSTEERVTDYQRPTNVQKRLSAHVQAYVFARMRTLSGRGEGVRLCSAVS